MALRIGINGFGRMGRLTARVLLKIPLLRLFISTTLLEMMLLHWRIYSISTLCMVAESRSECGIRCDGRWWADYFVSANKTIEETTGAVVI